MHIQWFPGHMAKSLREIEANLPLADVVLYVLDARAPRACLNPVFNEMAAHKPVIYVLNKADLVTGASVSAWVGELSQGGRAAVAVTGTASGAAQKILPLIQKMAAEKRAKYQNKGIRISLRGIVIGVPNTGKSTLINTFCGKAKTVTGNRPGVTRGKQWVRVSEYFELLDTPGTLYPKLSDQAAARHLAYIGSIKDEVTDIPALSRDFLGELSALCPSALKDRYGVVYDGDPDTAFEEIARARGLLHKGGAPDTERAAAAVLDDFRKGRLGKIALETALG